MSILCNTRCLDAKVTGVQRYTKSILHSFPDASYRTIQPSSSFSHGIKGHLWEQIVLPQKIKKNEVLWSPSNAGPLAVTRQVVTIHDLVPIDHPEWVTKTFAKWYQYLLPRLCNNSAHLIAISEFTKQRMIETMGIAEDKISVIYNGVDASFLNEPIFDFRSICPFENYILVLGALEPRKNILNLLKAWSNIAGSVDDSIGLVIVGAQGDSNVFGDFTVNKEAQRVFFTGYLEEKYIVSLYKNALFFAYLSFYEGFGLPPLEAMATGCPVIVSNVSAMPEIVGSTGLLVDPYNLEEIQDAMLRYFNDADLRKEKSIKGKERASRFLWETTAAKTFKVLSEI